MVELGLSPVQAASVRQLLPRLSQGGLWYCSKPGLEILVCCFCRALNTGIGQQQLGCEQVALHF